jgi:hypothetical protein
MAELRALRSGSIRRVRWWWWRSLGSQLWVISRRWWRLPMQTTLKTRKPLRLCQLYNPRFLRLTSTVFNYIEYEPSSFLNARQRQPSTESYRGNI